MHTLLPFVRYKFVTARRTNTPAFHSAWYIINTYDIAIF